jgi:hypothetical protein
MRVRIRSKFQRHNPDVLRCTISGVQSENSGVILSKFCSDLNQTSHHKHTLSVILDWVYDISFPIDVRLRNELKKKLTSCLPLVCSLRNGRRPQLDKRKNYTDEWIVMATYFLGRAFSRSKIVRCQWSICENSRCLANMRTIDIHLCKNSFVSGYEVWTFHSESGTSVIAEDEYNCDVGTLIGWMRCLKLYKEMSLRILLQQRLRRSSSFSKLQKSRFMNTQK